MDGAANGRVQSPPGIADIAVCTSLLTALFSPPTLQLTVMVNLTPSSLATGVPAAAVAISLPHRQLCNCADERITKMCYYNDTVCNEGAFRVCV